MRREPDRRCAVRDNLLDDRNEKMIEAYGSILASPGYCADVSCGMKVLIDRAGLVAKTNRDMFQRKVRASVVAVLRAGAIHAFDTINHLFFIGQMIVPGFSYRNIGLGELGPGNVLGEEGQMTMRTLGANTAWLLKKIAD